MTEQEKNKAVVKRYHDEVWTKGNAEVIDELLEQDYISRSLPPWRKPGAEGLKEFILGNHRIFPISRFKNGKVVEPWTIIDNMDLMQQLEAVQRSQ